MQIIHSGRDCLKAFAALLDRLIYSPARTTKLRLLEDYFRTVPDPDRGYALAALTGSLAWKLPVRPVLTELMAARTDPLLYRLSRDYVGDTAETVALLWPEPVGQVTQPRLADVCTALAGMQRGALAGALAGWLDQLDASGRFALLKLLTGAFRAGVSSRLAKTALASFGGRPIAEIEEIWHGLSAPYADLFAWLEGRSGRPDVTGALLFRPPMLAHPLGPDDLAALDLAAYAIEWKWDGIRVEIVSRGGATKLFTRTGDDISAGFPDLVSGFAFDAVLDGELLSSAMARSSPSTTCSSG